MKRVLAEICSPGRARLSACTTLICLEPFHTKSFFQVETPEGQTWMFWIIQPVSAFLPQWGVSSLPANSFVTLRLETPDKRLWWDHAPLGRANKTARPPLHHKKLWKPYHFRLKLQWENGYKPTERRFTIKPELFLGAISLKENVFRSQSTGESQW